jgi:membrane-bound lytic murein transglycosylase D
VVRQTKFRQDFTRYMNSYLKENRETLQKIKQRNASYFKVMDAMFTKYKLPSDLKYLAVVESELKYNAVSKVGAVGYWQLMPETAQLLGLKVTPGYDERKHLYKSTRAAAIYLRDLHREFGDWLLVLAAYNCGPGPVYKAIRKSGSRDFWKLQAYLPAETRGHVKRIIATRYYFEGQGAEADVAMSL